MKLFSQLLLLLLFLTVLAAVILFARGYRIDVKEKSVSSTGIIAINSFPKAAKIYVNGSLRGATDSNITLPPGNYQVEIKKDGYTGWSKTIKLKGELVVNLEPFLFPLNASLTPLTNLGVIKAIPIPENEKIIIMTGEGIFLFEANRRTLPFFQPLKTIVKKTLLPETIDFSSVETSFSPDFRQVIFDFGDFSYLLSLGEENLNPLDVSLSKNALIEAWQNQKLADDLKILESFPKEFTAVASDSFHIISFSPDENKILYKPSENLGLPLIISPPLIGANQSPEERFLKKDSLYLYDRKEDKNFLILPPTPYPLPPSIKWYFDSKHVVLEEDKKLSIVDYDSTNRQTIYSGPFDANFFMPTSEGKIIVLTNLNPESNKLPDLYLIGIR